MRQISLTLSEGEGGLIYGILKGNLGNMGTLDQAAANLEMGFIQMGFDAKTAKKIATQNVQDAVAVRERLAALLGPEFLAKFSEVEKAADGISFPAPDL